MTDIDSLAALRRANPRHDPAFDAAVAKVSDHTRDVLAAAVLGPAALGGAAWSPANHLRRLLMLLFSGAVVVTLSVVAVTTLGTPTAAPRRPQSPASAPSNPKAGPGGAAPTTETSAPPTTPTTAVTNTVAQTTAAPATVAPTSLAPPSPGAVSPPGGHPGPGSTGPVAPTVPRTTPTTGSPPTSAVLVAVPTCHAGTITPSTESVVVQDTGSGLAAISNVAITNGTVSVPRFAAGTRSTVAVVATKTDPTKRTQWSFDATDVAGHTTHCV